jgi:hypothetical protein
VADERMILIEFCAETRASEPRKTLPPMKTLIEKYYYLELCAKKSVLDDAKEIIFDI